MVSHYLMGHTIIVERRADGKLYAVLIRAQR